MGRNMDWFDLAGNAGSCECGNARGGFIKWE